MSARGDEAARKAHRWVSYADEDLRYAEHGLNMETPPYRLVAYHAQQCAEKYLKAFLVIRGIDFPYTHNIAILLELCSGHASWTETLHDAEELSQFAVTARYPGEDDEVEKDEAVRAIEPARLVQLAVLDILLDYP